MQVYYAFFFNIYVWAASTFINVLLASVFVPLPAAVSSRCFALFGLFLGPPAPVFFGIRLHMKWTEREHLIWRLPCFHSWSFPPFFTPSFFFFPDYRLSGSARIPFLTHQNGDIHLKDDICGEFLNNLIVIRHRRGRGGGYDGGE